MAWTCLAASGSVPAGRNCGAGVTVAAGADGVSVISALSLAPDPTDAAKTLRAVVDEALLARKLQ